jgi:sec-independent protein translocase protein TatA
MRYFAKNIIMVAATLLGIIGMQELILIGIIVLLFFGGRKIPELMRGLGKGVKSFKDGMKEEDEPSSPKTEQ